MSLIEIHTYKATQLYVHLQILDFLKKNDDVQQFVTMSNGGGGGIREVDMMMFHKRARILLLKVHIGLL